MCLFSEIEGLVKSGRLSWEESLQKIRGIYGNVTCTLATHTCAYTWSDPTGLTQYATLKVYSLDGFGKNLIYGQNTSSASGIMFYTVPAASWRNGTLYSAEGGIETNTANSFWVYDRAEMIGRAGDLGLWGGINNVLFGMMLLVCAMAFIFIDLGPAGIITGSMVALGVGAFLGWVPLTVPAIISLIIIGGIIISKVRGAQ